MLARVHALLGIVPLGAYLVFHLYQTWPALTDRELWVERALAAPSRGALAAWVFMSLALHVLLGALRLRRVPHVALNGAPALRTIQAVTGALVLAFLIYHVQQVWAVPEGPHASPRDAYAALFHELGRPLDAAVYVVGVTALCFHLSHGLARAAVTFRLSRTPQAVRGVRIGAGALGLALWVSLLQLLGHFAVGEPLFRFPS